MGAADHRAVPGRAPGRRAGHVPAGQEPAGRRARSRTRTAAATARATDPDPRPVTRRARPQDRPIRTPMRPAGTCRRCRSSSSVATGEIDALCRPARQQRLVEIVGPGGIGKTALAIATGRRLACRPAPGSGGVWLARLETAATPNDVIDTVIAALNIPGGEEALFERLKGTDGRGDPRQLRTRPRRRRGARSPPPRRRAGAADPVHQPGAARRRR